MSGMEIVERKRQLLMTASEEREFERIKIQIEWGNSDRLRYIGQLLVLLGIWDTREAREWEQDLTRRLRS